MISNLIGFWKLIYATYKEGEIQKIMYYYLTGVLGVVVILYFYILWQGIFGFSILFGAFTGAQHGIPITLVQAIGMVVIVRYSLLGGIDAVAQRTPANITERLAVIEDKLGELHFLAFGESDEPEDVKIEYKKRKDIEKKKEQKK